MPATATNARWLPKRTCAKPAISWLGFAISFAAFLRGLQTLYNYVTGIAVDGHSIGPIEPADTLRITAAGQRVKLVHPPGYDFYEILRSKLLWGRDSRIRASRKG